MTFIAGFYNFSIDLNHSDRGIFSAFRIKTPRHELESRVHLYARLIAFLHAYREGLEFSQGVSEPREPAIWQQDEIGNILTWIEIGTPEKRKLELSLKQHPKSEHRVYFYQQDDLSRFCHMLRGSKANWIKKVLFYTLPQDLLLQLEGLDTSSPHWSVSFIDDRVYLQVNDHDLEASIVQIDIWDEYQQSLLAGA
jgi:uncharacterized protein YaeQ